MIKRKDRWPLPIYGERSRPTVVASIDDESGAEPLIIRLGDFWNDFMRAGASRNSPEGHKPVVPLLDEMQGILQWE
jgi:hypothetical protein